VVGSWPLGREGRHPGQLLLLAIFAEAVPRLRHAPPHVSTMWLAGITLALMGYALLGLRYREGSEDVLLWLGGFLVAGVYCLRHALRDQMRGQQQTAHRADAPEPAPVDQPPPMLPPPRSRPLTRQQRQVLRLVATGLTVDAIATELSVSPTTVRTHLRDGYRRLGAHSRAEAIERARECGDLE
jgi:DNA-binding CsgD family transcriptional regulator